MLNSRQRALLKNLKFREKLLEQLLFKTTNALLETKKQIKKLEKKK
jgi:hypothetical protein